MFKPVHARKILVEEHQEIVEAYNAHDRVSDIAAKYAVTTRTIYRILYEKGIDTSKRLHPVQCSACGKTLMRHRGRIRKNYNSFCDYECYGAFCQANGPSGEKSRKSSMGRIAGRRVMAAEYGPLPPGSVVHHINGNNYDNRLENLMLFASQACHIHYHRKVFGYVILLDGRCYAMRPWPTLTRDNVIGAILLYFAR